MKVLNVYYMPAAEKQTTDTLSLTYHIENTPLGCIVLDNQSRILYWSARATEIFEWTEAEVKGKNVYQLPIVYKDDEELVARTIDEVKRGNLQRNQQVNRNYTRSRRVIWCEWYNSTLKDEAGEVVSVLCLVQDITERVMAEQALAKSQQQLSLIYNSANDPMWLIHIEKTGRFRFEDINTAFTEVTGLTPDKVIGHTIEEVLPASSHALVREKYNEAIQTGKVIDYLEVAVHPLGKRVGEIRVIPVKDERGKVTKIVGIANDITQRKRIEEELIERETKLRTILQTEPECIMLLDEECRVLEINPAGLLLIEADDASSVRGMPMNPLVGEPYRGDMRQLADDVCRGESRKLEFELTGLKGTHRHCLIHTVPLCDAQGKITALLAVIRDITEDKAQEEKLKDLNQKLRSLAAHIEEVREEERAEIAREIHDELGQQLTAIKMDVAWVAKKGDIQDHSVAQRLQDAMLLIDVMVNTVRRIATDLRPSILDDLGLQEALKWQTEEFQKRSGIHCQFTTNNKGAMIPPGIAITLFRIYQESLTNIRRHAGATEVVSELKINKQQLTLLIRDNGKGFDKREIERKKTLGILGMEERVLKLGGSLELQSEPQKGTLVKVVIPYPSLP
jgi:PAS domain S-box-containing protein